MIEIKTTNIFNNEELNFLVNESYTLFCKLKGYHNLSKENIDKLKDKLKSMYITNNNEDNKIYIAYKSDLIVGCACITNGNIRDIFVKEEYQRQGIGSLMLKKIISNIKENDEITLNTYYDVIGFYRKHGFIPIEQNENSIKMKR